MVKSKEIALATAAFMAACGRAPTLPPPQTRFETYTPTVVLPTLSPEPTEISTQYIQNKAGERFLETLGILSNYEDETLARIQDRLNQAQENGEIEVFTSEPFLDNNGSPVKLDPSFPLTCSFTKEGDFMMVINSNVYFLNPPLSPISTGARVYECLDYRRTVLSRFGEAKIKDPSLDFKNYFENNPNALSDSAVEAIYRTVGEIVMPHRQEIPSDDKVLSQVMTIFDSCQIDFSKHLSDPKKAKEDLACWKQQLNNLGIKPGIAL